MNPYDQYPIDYTGFGPAGTGGAPTLRELQQHQRSRYMTTRAAQAAGFLDPVAMAAAQKITRGVIGGSPTPDALRRAMFNSSTGQMAMDAAMIGRASGMLGQGDPITAAANIMQGIASGGFRASIGGSSSYGIGPVSGNGNISEHVSMAFMKGIMRDMTGGKGDGSQTNGFNVEEVSQLFKTFAQRGGIGRVAHIQQNASIATRLSAAAANAVDPSLQADMGQIKLSGSESEQISQLTALMGSTENKKLKQELKNVISSPSAIVINGDEKKRVTDFMKNMTDSLAGLADIYSEMSAPELQSKLESISGMRITNREQLAKATAMTNQLRGAAIVTGMDPRAFMDWSGDMQAQLRGDVANVTGADGRHSSMVSGMTATIHNRLMTDSAMAYKQAQSAVASGRELGVDLGDAPDLTEIYEDKRQGRMQFLDRYAGVTMAQGGMNNLSGGQRQQAERLLKEFQQTSDPEKRGMIEAQMKSLWASAYSRPGQEVDFEAVKASRSGKRMLENAFSDPAAAREMERMSAVGRRDALNINPMIKQLAAMGVSDAGVAGDHMLKDLGVKGMADMLRMAKTDFHLDENGKSTDRQLTGADRLKMQRDMLGRAGITGSKADTFLNNFFTKDGRMKNAAGFEGAMKFLNDADYEPGMATYDQADIGQSRLDMIGANQNRMKMSAGDKGLSFNSIATAIATGDIKSNSSDPEVMALMLDSLSAANMPLVMDKDGKMVSASTQYKTGINFEKGLNTEGIGHLSKILGKDIALHDKMVDPRTGKKFESMDALIEATKGDKNLLADAIGLLQTDKDYLGLNLSGGVGSMSAMSDAAKNSLTSSGVLDKKFKQAGGAMMLARSMGLSGDYKTSLMESLEKGAGPDLSFFAPDKFSKLQGSDAGFGEGLSRVMNLSNLVGASGGADLAALSSLDEGGQMTGKLEEQMAELEKAKQAGAKTVTYKADGKDVSASIDDVMKQLAATMERLETQQLADKGSTIVQEMVIQGNVRVGGDIAKEEKD